MPHIKYSVGNGQNISLWFDPWYNNTPICRESGSQLISHSGLPSNAKVSAILNQAGWILPSSNYHDLFVWKQNFDYSTHYNLQARDSIT